MRCVRIAIVMVGVVASVGASCGKGGGTVSEHEPAKVGEVAWRVAATATGGDANFSFLAIEGAAATRADRPIIVAGARFATDQPRATATFDGVGASDGEVINAHEAATETTIDTIGGEHYVIPSMPEVIRAAWYDLAPGVLGVMRTSRGATVIRLDGGATTPTWSRVIAAPVNDATVAGWLGPDPILRSSRGAEVELSRVRATDGVITTLATVAGRDARVAVGPGGARVAIVFSAEGSRCGGCTEIEIHDARSGQLAERVELPIGGDRISPFGKGVSIGFDDRQLWLYWYRAQHNSDVLGTTSPEVCRYEVYDLARGGALVRTLDAATGPWRELSAACHVRALLPTSDGGAIAVAVFAPREAVAVKFDAPP